MEIHISSLAYDPAINGPNNSLQQPRSKQNSAEPQTGLSAERLSDAMPDTASLQKKYELSKALSKSDQTAELDIRNRKALNAYAATLNQPILEEKQALAGIDFFV